MSGRRARGETLAMVLKALRENPRGLTTRELSEATGIPFVLLGIQLGNFRSAEEIQSRGSRRAYTWYIEGLADVRCSRHGEQLPARSIFAPSAPAVSAFAPPRSRVMASQEGGVQADDYSEGAFMRDWQARRSSPEAA